jgi:hypothetical protein
MSNLPVAATSSIPAQADDMAYAQRLVASKLMPDGMTTEQAVLILEQGRELGLKPLDAVRGLYVVHNRVAMMSTLIDHLFKRRGHRYIPVESTDQKCVIKFILRSGETYSHTLTRAEATAAGWDSDRNGTKEMWRKLPRIMLFYRCLTSGIRMVDPGCLLGSQMEDEFTDAVLNEEQVAPYETPRATPAQLEMKERDLMDQLVDPTPGMGWDTWGATKCKQFLRINERAGLTGDALLAEYGVADMREWIYSIDQTRDVLELLAWSPDLTVAEKKKALGIFRLRELVEHGMSFEECKTYIGQHMDQSV